MEIGVIGLGGNGRAVVGQLLEKTARNLSVYDRTAGASAAP